jgi:hypothetical protein
LADTDNAFAADRTLGRRCDRAEAEAQRSVGLAIEGAATQKAAVSIVLHYSTSDPLA